MFVHKPYKAPKPFYESQTIAEPGHCLANEIIGGKLIPYHFENPDRLLSAIDWPDDRYFSKSGSFEIPHKDAPIEPVTEVFIVDTKYISRAFRQEFWDQVGLLEPMDRGNVFKMPRTEGYLLDSCTPENLTKRSRATRPMATKSRKLTQRRFGT